MAETVLQYVLKSPADRDRDEQLALEVGILRAVLRAGLTRQQSDVLIEQLRHEGVMLPEDDDG